MKLYNLIYKLLIDRPDLRNSDRRLMWAVWEREGAISYGALTLDSFLRKSTSSESIRRTRQKIQQEYPNLQASKHVEDMRKAIEDKKGTFIFRQII